MKIEGNTAIITGGGSGMGAATAELLAKQGAHVVLFDMNLEAAEKVASKTNGLACEVNVTDEQSVANALAIVAKKFDVPRICVNCAGIAPAGRVVGKSGPMPLENFAKVIQVNLIGTFNVMRLVAAEMLKADPVGEDGERGVIVNTASVAAYEGQIGQSAYSASKGGVVGLTLPAAREFAQFGVRVMAIAPGLVDTPMLMGLPEEVRESIAAGIPFPKRFAKPSEYAQLVEQIISNPMLNGSVIRLDGALRMQPK